MLIVWKRNVLRNDVKRNLKSKFYKVKRIKCIYLLNCYLAGNIGHRSLRYNRRMNYIERVNKIIRYKITQF